MMTTQIIPNLTFKRTTADEGSSRSSGPDTGQSVLLTDDLTSPADFLLLSFLDHDLRTEDSDAIFVTSRDVLHWKSVASKRVS